MRARMAKQTVAADDTAFACRGRSHWMPGVRRGKAEPAFAGTTGKSLSADGSRA
jgi:hypothetical protein